MVLVGDFNKEVIGLFKSKYPTEKEKLLELNLTSFCKNPSFSYNISTPLNGGKNGNKVKCCGDGNGCCEENSSNNNGRQIFSLDGNSTLKWNVCSSQMETKMDMNGISIMEVKTRPYYGISLTSRYERFPKLANSLGSYSNTNNGTGCLEIGGDIQGEYIQSRFRISPAIKTLGCLNKSNKENKDSIGMMLSNTITLRPFSCINSLSLGSMISCSNINLPYKNKNSLKLMLGLMVKGPLFMGSFNDTVNERSQGLINKKENFGSRFKNSMICNSNYDNSSNDLYEGVGGSFTQSPNYVLSFQTNSDHQNNKLSGFTGGLVLNNLVGNYLTLGLMVSYNTGNSSAGKNNKDNIQQIEDNNELGLIAKNKGPKTCYENYLTKFSEKVQYTLGGKISFGSMSDSNNMKSTDLRFKVMNNLKMAYSLTHNFTSNISATFGAQIDPRKLNDPDSVKYGFILDMSA
ncbi:hypothetical protein CmeUKMEL1_18110 [Cryptosporidium meleagridis]|uniref:Uncharacterized protein n=1 Tax=Cryptosporidium meleagridis TaxID=93969 RepID=A0A2P4Z6E7_9CRYT|nr:hypothetical protein CmeUKMEL1_18110 [Cryptosporidium meleagridis]